jgi:hypothetical protein
VQRKAILASALAGAGDTEQACAVGQNLTNQAASLRSALVLSDLRRLADVVGTTGPGGEFRRRVQQLVAAQPRPTPR